MGIIYKSIADMNKCLLQNLHKFPHDVDLVVGIPRSGMLPANLLALYLNKPLTDIDSFIEGRVFASGERGKFINNNYSQKVIIIDDSFDKGGALKKAKEKIASNELCQNYDIKYGVVYTTRLGVEQLDFWCEVTDSYRIFQWNLFHHKSLLGSSCFDIDGVLCPNPPFDDDGSVYTEYIQNAPLLYVPSVEIDMLVSCRLEKYRGITEEWLRKNNIKYKKLVMLDLPDKESRIKWGKHGEYKAEVYMHSGNMFFVESSLAEASIIKKITGKDVFCTETFEMLSSSNYFSKAITLPLYRRIVNGIKKLIKLIQR